MNLNERLKGCLVFGAIGDAIGSRYEGSVSNPFMDFDFQWKISDDTQLTLATCEAICDSEKIDPEKIASRFLYWFNQRRLSGIGSSTLKALRELQVGGHWALVGNTGERAAGNGAAMRIAPLGFKKATDRQIIKDVCAITHKNDEAYAGALAIYYSIINIITGDATDVFERIIDELPDTNVRDRFIEMNRFKKNTISEIGQRFKPTGYVVDSVPLSVFASQKINRLECKELFIELIKLGGDTDTICSMTGQIIGTSLGFSSVPADLLNRYYDLGIDSLIDDLVGKWTE